MIVKADVYANTAANNHQPRSRLRRSIEPHDMLRRTEKKYAAHQLLCIRVCSVTWCLLVRKEGVRGYCGFVGAVLTIEKILTINVSTLFWSQTNSLSSDKLQRQLHGTLCTTCRWAASLLLTIFGVACAAVTTRLLGRHKNGVMMRS